MRHCIPCNADYQDDPHRCPDCRSRTLTTAERDLWYQVRDDLTQEEFVPVYVLDGPVDQAFLSELLTDADVPWVIQGGQGDPLGSAYRSQMGWGVVLVAEDSVERAREVIEMYENSVVVEDPDAVSEEDEESEG